MPDEPKEDFHSFRGDNTFEGAKEVIMKMMNEGIAGLIFAAHKTTGEKPPIIIFTTGPMVPMDIETAEKLHAAFGRTIERAKVYARTGE